MSSREARDGSSAHQARTWAHMPTMAWASTSESKQSSSETGGQRLASPLAHAFREMLENAGADPGGFAAGVERDAQQVSLLRGKADQDFGLCLHDDVGVRLVLLQSLESTLQLGGGVFGQLPEQGELVLEIEVEGAGGVAGARGPTAPPIAFSATRSQCVDPNHRGLPINLCALVTGSHALSAMVERKCMLLCVSPASSTPPFCIF